MKMAKSFRTLAAVVALVMVISLQMSIFADEAAQVVSAPVEQPSAWALEGVQWSSIYGLAPSNMYVGYNEKASREELYTVCVSVYEKLTGGVITPIQNDLLSGTDSQSILKARAINILTETEKVEPLKEATRLEMVTGVYNVLKAAKLGFDFESGVNLTYKDVEKIPENSLDIVKYSVSKGILNGRSKEILDIGSTCTRQELIVFAKNSYEFAVYEAGKDSKGAFWKVSDEDSTVYLLGSVHVADSSMYPLSKDILKAYNDSDALVVEADISEQEEATKYMSKMAMYTDENTLDKNITKEVYERFVEFITPYGVKPEAYNKFKPWYAALLVQNLKLAQNSYSANLGIDIFFLSKAMEAKEIVEIEGVKFQVDMFDSFSSELQEQFLGSSLSSSEENKEEEMKVFADIMKQWKTGNIAELEKTVKTNTEGAEELKEFNDKMWGARDKNMTEKVKGYLADTEKKTYFVVVGAGHMVGETGIVKQLEGQYEVEQIK